MEAIPAQWSIKECVMDGNRSTQEARIFKQGTTHSYMVSHNIAPYLLHVASTRLNKLQCTVCTSTVHFMALIMGEQPPLCFYSL